jgi:DnaK suppressor protein
MQPTWIMQVSTAKARKFRDRLDERRRALLVRYKDALDRADEELAGHATELVDVASDQWDARVLSLMSEADAEALENIVGALKRLERGTYGVCASCGEAIATARLEILPEVAECAECATFAEQQRPRWVNEVS